MLTMNWPFSNMNKDSLSFSIEKYTTRTGNQLYKNYGSRTSGLFLIGKYNYTRCLTLSEGLVNGVVTLVHGAGPTCQISSRSVAK